MRCLLRCLPSQDLVPESPTGVGRPILFAYAFDVDDTSLDSAAELFQKAFSEVMNEMREDVALKAEVSVEEGSLILTVIVVSVAVTTPGVNVVIGGGVVSFIGVALLQGALQEVGALLFRSARRLFKKEPKREDRVLGIDRMGQLAADAVSSRNGCPTRVVGVNARDKEIVFSIEELEPCADIVEVRFNWENGTVFP